MADNAAQAIKDLKKNIDSLDISLDNALKSHEKYTQMIAKTFQDAANQGKTSIDELVAYIGKKTKQVSAEKIKLQIDLGLGKKGELEQQIASMKSDIAKYEKSKDTHAAELLKQQLKDLEDEYKRLASASKKSAAQMYDDMLKIVNAAAGTKKDGKGTALGQARAAAAKENLNTIKEIDRLTTQIAEKQEKLGKYKEGSKNWEKTKKDIEEAGKKLQQYQDKLNRLQGRKVEDASAKAIKAQVANMRELYNLNKQYRQMMSQRRQGMLVNPQDLADTQQRLREIIATMKRIESEHPGSRKTAAARLETERLRDRWKEANKETKANRHELDKMLPTLQRLASAFGIAISVRGLAQFGKKLIEVRGEFELQQVALRSILQNKQLADEIWDKTLRASLQSPFTAMQLTKYTKQLAAYRIETEKLFDTTKRLADVSAGLGVDMQRLILAYGQVKAANYLRASEIRQFTEAGVNILGELSAYLTEVKGEFISTAQVMDMVQKRMIRFEDVAEIFKRMTDQGGIFYNMQYIQSQTVKGQLMKLRDAYDQMMNNIGKSNEGVMKNMVSILLNIVQNWREWKTAIDVIAFPALTMTLIKFSKGLFAANAATIATSKSFGTLTTAGAKLNVALKGLGATLKAHPLILLATVLFTVGDAMWNHIKAVKAVNDNYDDLNARLLETQHKMSSYEEKISQNNSILNDSTKSQKEQNKAQKDNAKILGELKRDYPDVADGISIAENGVISMTKSMKAYNAELRLQIQLNERAKASFFDQSAQKDAQQFDESLNKQQQLLAQYTAAAARESEVRKNTLEQNKQWSDQTKQYAKDVIKALEMVAKATSVEEYEEARAALPDDIRRLGGYKSITGNRKLQSRRTEVMREIAEDYKYFGDYLRSITTLSDDVYDNMLMTTEGFIQQNHDVIQNMLYTVKEDGTKEIGELGFALSKAFADAASNLSQTEQGRQEIVNELMRQFKEIYGLDVEFGIKKKNTTREDDLEQNKKYFSKMLSLIREMRAEYDKLSKSAFDAATSQSTVRSAYAQSVREILGKAGVTENYDFTTNDGMIAALRRVKEFASKLGEEEAAQVQKYISQLTADIQINAQVKVREDFTKDIEKMFNNYDLTIDLEKLSLPVGELAGIFQYDITTLDMIREKLKGKEDELRASGNLSEDAVKMFENLNNKIDDMDRKALVNRLKTYTAYLEKGRDEAVKIHLDELKKMAELDALYEKGYYTETQYTDIQSKIRKETDQALAKKKWEDFKKSDFYVTMFEDMGNVADVSIDIMIKKLEALKEEVKKLDPTQVKEIVKAIDKLEKTKRARSPFGTFIDDLKTVRKWQKGDRETQLPYWEKQEKYWQEQHDLAAKEVATLQEQFDLLSQDGIEGNEERTKKRLEERTKWLNTTNKALEKAKQNTADITNEQNEGYAAWVRYHNGVAKGAQDFSNAAQAAGTIAEDMMTMFSEADNASKKLAHDLADIAVNAGMLVADIAKAIASKGTDVGSMIDGLVRTWNIIKSSISASERDINKTIEENRIQLERLANTLEKVRKARDKAWNTQAVINASHQIEDALNKQKEAYTAMMNAEKARKGTDWDAVRQYEQAIDEINEALKDEKQQLLEIFGGLGEEGYRGEAQNFVDAWKEAFLETGDGLQGLQDHFDEFLNKWFVKQATMRVAGRMLEPLFKQIDNAVDESSQGGANVLLSELQRVREKFATIAPQLSDSLEQLAGMWGLGDTEGGLSGLAAGIQGMTEEQANILEAYWNSVRGYAASIDMKVSRIADMLGAGSRDITNPQLQQLQLIAANAQATHQLLLSTSKSGHPMGGYGFKVFND